jgi:hypothetical protein
VTPSTSASKNRLLIEGWNVVNAKDVSISARALPAEHAASYIKTVGKMQENVLTLYARRRFGRIIPAVGSARAIRMNVRLWMWLAWTAFLILSAIAHR